MLTVRSLSVGPRGAPRLCDIAFDVACGTALCLLGPNGSGKTTLLRAVLGTQPCTAGEVRFGAARLCAMGAREQARITAYIPQTHRAAFAPRVLDVVMMGRTRFGTPTRADAPLAREALARVGMEAFHTRVFATLSGGEQKLVLIARALCQQARVLLLDEPASDLDFANQRRLLTLLQALKRDGYAVIFSSHAPEHAFAVADQALLLRGGRMLALGAPGDVLTGASLTALYGTAMAVYRVRDETGHTRRVCLPGDPGITPTDTDDR